jgi:VanZ family protein
VRNILLYLPLGFCLMLLLRTKLGTLWATVLATFIGSVLSLTIEVLQVYLSIRVPSLMDVVLNAAGTCIGAIGGVIWRGLSSLVYVAPNSRQRPGDRSALVLILIWIMWRLAEFDLSVSLSRLKLALGPLMEGGYSLSIVAQFLLFWLIVAQAVLSFAHRQRGNESLLIVIALVLVGRLLFVISPFNVSELIALVLLLPALVILHKLASSIQAVLLFTALAVWFIYQQLAPFHLTEKPHSFDYLSVMRWITEGMPIDLGFLFSELFVFAALIWSLKQLGLSMRTAMLLVVTSVLAIEVVQLWQMERSSSLTDPFLAAAIGVVMRLASNERSHKTRLSKR